MHWFDPQVKQDGQLKTVEIQRMWMGRGIAVNVSNFQLLSRESELDASILN